MKKEIKVLIAEDIESLRNRYVKQLSANSDIKIVSLCKNGYEAFSNTVIHKPDIILMDIEMESKYSGILVTTQIMNAFPDIKIIMLTVSDEDESIFSAFQAGAYNYVLKTITTKELIKTIEDAYYDRIVFDSTISKKMRKEFQRIRKNENALLSVIALIQLLTDAERNIIYNLHLGFTQNELSNNLCIEKSTMKTHVRNIKKKLKCKTIDDAVKSIEKSGYFYYYEKINKIESP